MWSLILEPGKKYVTIVDYTFNLSMAILNLTTVKRKKEIHTVYIETEDTPSSIICHLSEASKLVQVKLDLVFPPGTKLKLFTSGSAQIHMTGYLSYIEENNTLYSNFKHKMIKDATDSTNSKIENDSKRKAEDDIPKGIKSIRFNESNQYDKDSDDVKIVNQFRKNQLGELLYDKAENSISSNDNHEIVDELLLTKNGKSPNIPDKPFDKNKQKPTKKYQTTLENTTLLLNAPITNQSLPNYFTELSGEDKNEPTISLKPKLKTYTRKVSYIGNEQDTTLNDQEKAHQTPIAIQYLSNDSTKSSNETKSSELKTFTRRVEQNQQLIKLSDGVKIQELQVGNGAVVEPGKNIKIYYIGRIKTTGQVFDSIKDGPGLSFVFQNGEVIKGWDVGIAGMKVGGKRRIICPPKMGQGKTLKPSVKPRSTMDFEVELLHVG